MCGEEIECKKINKLRDARDEKKNVVKILRVTNKNMRVANKKMHVTIKCVC